MSQTLIEQLENGLACAKSKGEIDQLLFRVAKVSPEILGSERYKKFFERAGARIIDLSQMEVVNNPIGEFNAKNKVSELRKEDIKGDKEVSKETQVELKKDINLNIVNKANISSFGAVIKMDPLKYFWFSKVPGQRLNVSRVFNSETGEYEAMPVFSKSWKMYLSALSFGRRSIVKCLNFWGRLKKTLHFDVEEIQFSDQRYLGIMYHLSQIFKLQESVFDRLEPVDYLHLAKNELDRNSVPFGYRPVSTFGFRTSFVTNSGQEICFSTIAGLIFAKISPSVEKDQDFGRLILRFSDDNLVWAGNGTKPDKEKNPEAFKTLVDSILYYFLKQREDNFFFVSLRRS